MPLGRKKGNAFTLIEMLVVVGVISILIGAILAVGSTVVAGAKVRETKVLIQKLDLAVQQFTDDAPLAKVLDYNEHYAKNHPPDELEAFIVGGYTNPRQLFTTIAPGGGDLVYPQQPALAEVEHRDVKAMALAMRLFSPAAAGILDHIDKRFRRVDADEYLDNANTANYQVPLEYYVDSWKTPIEYFSNKDEKAQPPRNAFTDPLGLRRITSKFLVRANNELAVLVSYGPDGQEQTSPEYDTNNSGWGRMVDDYHDVTSPRKITHRFNDDNVYNNDNLAGKLSKDTR